MTAVVLDTHALVWLLEGQQRLGPQARELAHAAAKEDTLLVSAMTFWEVAMLTQRQRLALTQSVLSWRRRVLELGLVEVPVSGEIGIMSTELDGFPPDPADRIIAATALTNDATLITADAGILAWQGALGRHDAEK